MKYLKYVLGRFVGHCNNDYYFTPSLCLLFGWDAFALITCFLSAQCKLLNMCLGLDNDLCPL